MKQYSCTFFGHSDCPNDIRPQLCKAITDLIVNKNVNTFYVGNNGQYDSMVRSVIRELQTVYPQIRYAVVLAYLPVKQTEVGKRYDDSMLPDGIENVPRRFAISWRNDWMLEHSDYVITYVTHSWGGAAQFAAKSEKKGKKVIHIR